MNLLEGIIMDTDKKYALKYFLDFEQKEGGFSIDDVKSDNEGLTDAFFFVSCLYGDKENEAAINIRNGFFDGRRKVHTTEEEEVDVNTFFFIMFCLADSLKDDEGLTESVREALKEMCEKIRNIRKNSGYLFS